MLDDARVGMTVQYTGEGVETGEKFQPVPDEGAIQPDDKEEDGKVESYNIEYDIQMPQLCLRLDPRGEYEIIRQNPAVFGFLYQQGPVRAFRSGAVVLDYLFHNAPSLTEQLYLPGEFFFSLDKGQITAFPHEIPEQRIYIANERVAAHIHQFSFRDPLDRSPDDSQVIDDDLVTAERADFTGNEPRVQDTERDKHYRYDQKIP
jgi:hypothetical protein